MNAGAPGRGRDLARVPGPAVPVPFTFDGFCAEVAAWRGRELQVSFVRFGCDLTGLWVPFDDRDTVFIEEQVPEFMRWHVFAHEVGHMMLATAHAPSQVAAARGALARLVPEELLAPALAQVHARTRYEDEQERDAELLAGRLMREARRATAPARAGSPAAERVGRAFT